LARGGRLVYAGAGSSGRLAVVDAAECGPTFGAAPEQVVALVAGGAGALATAQEAAEDDEDAGFADVTGLGIGPDDAVVTLSASGGTPYAVGAARAADEVEAALDASGGEAKVAIVTLLAGIDAETARARLREAGGAVRGALAPR